MAGTETFKTYVNNLLSAGSPLTGAETYYAIQNGNSVQVLGNQLKSFFGATYYVSNSGNDNNNGLSPGTAWQTIAHVNAQTFNPGDAILFNGGQTFVGNIVCPQSGLPGKPITFSSYGGGRATISSGSGIGFSSTDQQGITVRDLIFSGTSTSTSWGIVLNNNNEPQLYGIAIIDCDVSNYGQDGILLNANGPPGVGYSDVLINGCTVSNCTTASLRACGGIRLRNDAAALTTQNLFTNVTISNCISHDNPGFSTRQSFGFALESMTNALVIGCTAYNNGAVGASPSGGPSGFWIAASANVTISNCVSHNNSTGNTSDGDGFDLGNGDTNLVLFDCLTYNNFGPGYLCFGASLFGNTDGLQLINCVSINDGTGGSGAASPYSILIGKDGPGTQFTNTKVSGCTFYQGNANTQALFINEAGGTHSSLTGDIFDNNFIVSGGQTTISCGSDAQGFIIAGNRYSSVSGAFTISWTGNTYHTVTDWQRAFGYEATNYTPILGNADVNGNISSTGSLPTVYFNDTETHGHKYGLQAEVNGTTPCFYLFDQTGSVSHWCASFDGLGSFQVRSGAAFGWSASATAADAVAMDTGISRTAAATIALGNGTAGDTSADVKLASVNELPIRMPSTDSASNSVAIGRLALNSLPASANFSNIAIGAQTMSGASMTTAAIHNVGVGVQALSKITTGHDNVGVGNAAGINITSGASNFCLGSSAGATVAAGVQNVLIGTNAMNSIDTGNCVAIGHGALIGLATSANGANCAVGFQAAQSLTNGSYNTLIGSWAGNATMNNVIALSDGQGNLKLDYNATNTGEWTAASALVAGGFVANADPGGTASTNTMSNGNSTTISTGVGSVKMSTGNAATNTGWLKCYIGTQVAWIPCWTTNAP